MGKLVISTLENEGFFLFGLCKRYLLELLRNQYIPSPNEVLHVIIKMYRDFIYIERGPLRKETED